MLLAATFWIRYLWVVPPAITAAGSDQWKAHEVRQINGWASAIRLPAKVQIVTESWNRVAAVPYVRTRNLHLDRRRPHMVRREEALRLGPAS